MQSQLGRRRLQESASLKGRVGRQAWGKVWSLAQESLNSVIGRHLAIVVCRSSSGLLRQQRLCCWALSGPGLQHSKDGEVRVGPNLCGLWV